MPFPDGSGLDIDPFTAQNQANAEMLGETGHGDNIGPAPGGASVAWPDGMQAPADAAFQEGMPAYLSSPSAYVPNPNDRDESGMQLADPRTAATRPDLNLDTSTIAPELPPGHNPAPDDDGTRVENRPPNLRPGTTSVNCGGCRYFDDQRCTLHNGYLVDATQVSDDFAPRVSSSADNYSAHQAQVFQPELAKIDLAMDDNGRFWKVACKTGTLALSPGPGQVDLDKPLVLNDELFDDIKLAFDEKAFPYVTVPETHANGSLENTGYVKAVEVLSKSALMADERIDPAVKGVIVDDSDSTKYLLTGIDFTDPTAKEKALNGSIPDTSVGVKFGYRAKRSGKGYRAALEHLALTPVPWVDGLIPFGAAALGAQPFDQDQKDDTPYDGVFLQLSQAQLDELRTRQKDVGVDLSQDLYATEGLSVELAVLKSKTRNALKDSDFALSSERKYPIHDESHAKNALSRASGKPEEATVKAAVYKRYPHLKSDSTNASAEQQVANLMALGMRVSFSNDRWDDIAINLDQATEAMGRMTEGDRLELPMGVCISRATDSGTPVYVVNEGYTGPVTVRHEIGLAIDTAAQAMARLKAEAEADRYRDQAIAVKYSVNGDHPTLPERDPAGTIPAELHASNPSNGDRATMTVEEILAAQQAEQEASAQRIAELESQLQASAVTQQTQGATIHGNEVKDKIKRLTDAGLPPAVLLAARQIFSEDKPWERAEGFNLSVQVPKAPVDGKPPEFEAKDLKTPSEIVDFILSAMPTVEAGEAARMANLHTNLAASHEAEQDLRLSAKQQVEAHEREKHPERFADDGKGDRL